MESFHLSNLSRSKDNVKIILSPLDLIETGTEMVFFYTSGKINTMQGTKWLLFATYNLTLQFHEYFFGEVGKSLEKYSQIYNKFLLIGDFKAGESVLAQFLHDYNAVNIIHENTCYKSMNNPSCSDLIITNSPNSIQSTSTFCTGLSDFHKLVVTVLKTSFRKKHLKKFLTEIITNLTLMILKLN